MGKPSITSNCMLCEEHSLNVMQTDGDTVMQCLNCGYISTEKFFMDDTEFNNLPEDVKKWAKKVENRYWIPITMALPFGMLYPIENEHKNMVWAFSEMIEIPEEDRKNYPDDKGGFYEKRFNTDNPKVYDTFLEGMVKLNEKAKSMAEAEKPVQQEIKLPKLKKTDG